MTSQSLTSLYIPGYEGPQPVNATILGIGSDSRTTWLLHGEETLSATAPNELLGTATLAVGPLDVSLTYANSAAHFTIGQLCTMRSLSAATFAICTIVAQGSTAVQTEIISPVPVFIETSLRDATLISSIITLSASAPSHSSTVLSSSSPSQSTSTSSPEPQSSLPIPLQTSGGHVAIGRKIKLIILVFFVFFISLDPFPAF